MTFYDLKTLVMAAPQFKTRAHIWHHYLSLADAHTVFAEFGVFNGRSINYMADVRPDNIFHGFDSFEGLPEDWIPCAPKGHFKTDLSKLKFCSNVQIHAGMFDQSIPQAQGRISNVSSIHIDCDLKVSTDAVLNLLEPQIVGNKATLLFDEFYNYNGFEDHEFLSFLEFVGRTKVQFQVLGRNINHQQVLIQII